MMEHQELAKKSEIYIPGGHLASLHDLLCHLSSTHFDSSEKHFRCRFTKPAPQDTGQVLHCDHGPHLAAK